MITRIELHNFMSHPKTVIEPSAGLTVLVGPNNVGKSAVIAALQILCTNENSTYVKRHGSRECAVIVHTSEGHVVEWRRRQSPRYVIDGVEFSRLGNAGVPPELHQALRLPPVAEENDDSFNVHFGSQKSPIFLLNSRPSAAARFFASSSDASRLLEMQQRHKENVTEARRQQKQLESEAAVVNAELAVLEQTVPVSEQLAQLEQDYQTLLSLERQVAELSRCEAELSLRANDAEQQRRRTEVLQPLSAPPELEDPAPLAVHTDRLDQLERQVFRVTAESSALALLKSPPEYDDDAILETLATRLGQASADERRLSEQGRVLCSLIPIPEQNDVVALEALCNQLVRQTANVQRSSTIMASLTRLAPVPELSPVGDLTMSLERLARQVSQAEHSARIHRVLAALEAPADMTDESAVAAAAETMADAVERVASSRRELADLIGELQGLTMEIQQTIEGQDCPTCGQPLSAEHLMAAAIQREGGHHE